MSRQHQALPPTPNRSVTTVMPAPKIVIGAQQGLLEQEADTAAQAYQTRSPITVANPGRLAGTDAGSAPVRVHGVLNQPGVSLDASVRDEMERRFGHDFSKVRVHTDPEAAQSAREVRARAYTVGNDLVFGSGQYLPDSGAGRRLIAHELTHVVQQAKAECSFGTEQGQPHARAEGEAKQLFVQGGTETQLLQREPEDSPAPTETPPASPTPETSDASASPDAGAQPAQAAPATPTLTLGPAATLTRSDTLTATVGFTANAGETMNISAWRYTTSSQGDVNRAATEANFQSSWSGAMAQSGTLEVDYAVTPAGGTAGSTQTLSQAVTVNDRTGATWASSPTLRDENAFSGRPSPPRVFSDLGRHNVTITNPAATATNISAGPNTGFSFVGSLTAGSYISQPRIHPDLTNATSTFKTFHNDPSRLYLEVGATRTLIPLTEYSGLSVAGGTLTFTVPDWEAFYKARNFYEVTATGASGAGPVPVRNAWWGLASNSQTANLRVLDGAAIRAALSIPATESFSLSATPRGSWDGYQLMQSAAILTGTRSHEYVHAQHSHRANFTAMLRALDPQRKVEQLVSSPSSTVNFTTKITEWVAEIMKPDHELVDEAASRTAEAFTAIAGQDMAGVNTDPGSGAFLGSVWNISADRQMRN